MADLSDAQRKRAEARQRRRKAAEPEPEAEKNTGDGQDSHQGVRQAAKVAAAVGAAGAAAAAAKALGSHDDDSDRPEDEPRADTARDEAEAVPEPEPEPRNDEHEPPVTGAAQSDARRAIDRAREQLQDLLERQVEQVSSLERTHDGWVLAVEVVELQRVPETTDVLASYEMELDDSLGLRRYQQVRRYHRGRTDDGERA